jgi:hypothetical protein
MQQRNTNATFWKREKQNEKFHIVVLSAFTSLAQQNKTMTNGMQKHDIYEKVVLGWIFISNTVIFGCRLSILPYGFYVRFVF